jgi:hypothetical protein
MAYVRASGDGEYQVSSPNSGHDERVTPDERAPLICGRFLFSVPFDEPAMTKARNFFRAFAFRD